MPTLDNELTAIGCCIVSSGASLPEVRQYTELIATWLKKFGRTETIKLINAARRCCPPGA